MMRFLLIFFLLFAWTSSAATARAQTADGESERQDTGSPGFQEYHEAYRSPEGAALRSIVVPGWGQHYNGEPTKGWILGSVAVVGLLLGTEIIKPGILSRDNERHNLEQSFGWFCYAGSVAWATVDAYLRAQTINRENGYDLGIQGGSSMKYRVTLVSLSF
ncbi:MAG TPA: hypothetical protein VKA63_00460 [Candidatus Krumholzibacteria bacterium]|nr:hypothetical protein [Candidatus Krumholzibacteria bacterium]